MQRFIIEMGMGNSLHKADYTVAAGRAIEDAIRHSTIPMLSALGIDHREMRVDVTVGVQAPSKVDVEELKTRLPRGTVTVTVVHGGLDVSNPDSGEINVVATAAVEAFLPVDLVRDRAL